VLVQFLRQSDDVLFWINDKEAFVTAEEFGHDLEHVEVLQRKFDEFQKDMATQEYRCPSQLISFLSFEQYFCPQIL
jgi:spectrin alpha